MFPENQLVTISDGTNVSALPEGFDLNQMVEAENPEADINIQPPPPPRKVYPIKWSLGEKGIYGKATDKSGSFWVIPLEGTIVDETSPYNGFKVFDYLNTIVNKRIGTSSAHSFCAKLGEILPKSANLMELKAKLEEVFAQNPVGMALLDWKVSRKPTAEEIAKGKRENDYVTVKNYHTMNNFPKNEDGTFNHIVPSDVDGGDLVAQVYVVEHVAN